MSGRGVLRILSDHQLGFWCPGCEEMHVVRVAGSAPWGFNGDYDRPTFTPSVLVTSGHYVDGQSGKDCWCTFEERTGRSSPFKCHRCHSFVTDGLIRFLGDCSHSLANQTVELKPFDLEALYGTD